MNVLILAAGYATRLYPLTLHKAKPLLNVAGKPMLEWVLDNLRQVPGIDQVYVVTNEKFADDFTYWADEYHAKHTEWGFKIINDHSTGDDNKLGAIGDIELVIRQENLESNLLVVAGDNLFSQSQAEFVRLARDKPAAIATYDVGSLDAVKKYASIDIDEQNRIAKFQEKPDNPTSSLAGIALYFYHKETLPLIKQYIAEGNNPDQPGRLIQWLYQRIPTYAYPIDGIWYDIGSRESLDEADRVFSNLGEKEASTPTA